jgi:hypothetical protein
MNKKLILKLLSLVAGLIFVVVLSQYLSSGQMKTALNGLFGVESASKLNWCADHVVDVAWTSPEVPENLKKLSLPNLRDNYCELKIEAISGVELDKVEWAPLAESSGATGIKTILEWNSSLQLFRSGGLPFKSSSLSLQLQK